MKEPKFKVGDKVRVLDGSKIRNYYGNWVNGMTDCVGKVYEVDDVIRISFYYDDRYGYVLKGLSWKFDERGLELAEDEEPEERITIYREGRNVIAKNELTGEKGVAKCSPEDEFVFRFGAGLALRRLLSLDFKVGDIVESLFVSQDLPFKMKFPLKVTKIFENGFIGATLEGGLEVGLNPVGLKVRAPEYFTGKAVYVGNKYFGFFTKGKIYEFENGIGCYDDGTKSRKPFKTIEQYNEWLGETAFVEIVE